jgi:hypothetical protein
MLKLISIVLRTMAGLKATYFGRSLKSRIFGDFTRKISKNGHLWGKAKMAPPWDTPKSGIHRAEKTIESYPATPAELNFLTCGGASRVFTESTILMNVRESPLSRWRTESFSRVGLHRHVDGISKLKNTKVRRCWRLNDRDERRRGLDHDVISRLNGFYSKLCCLR